MYTQNSLILSLILVLPHKCHTFQSFIVDLQTVWPSIPLSSIRNDCKDVKRVVN